MYNDLIIKAYDELLELGNIKINLDNKNKYICEHSGDKLDHITFSFEKINLSHLLGLHTTILVKKNGRGLFHPKTIYKRIKNKQIMIKRTEETIDYLKNNRTTTVKTINIAKINKLIDNRDNIHNIINIIKNLEKIIIYKGDESAQGSHYIMFKLISGKNLNLGIMHDVGNKFFPSSFVVQDKLNTVYQNKQIIMDVVSIETRK